MPDTLLPCPFCGRPEPDFGTFNDGHPRWSIRCLGCRAEIERAWRIEYEMKPEEYERSSAHCKALVIAAWNKRAFLPMAYFTEGQIEFHFSNESTEKSKEA